jgi:hypothetical protein
MQLNKYFIDAAAYFEHGLLIRYDTEPRSVEKSIDLCLYMQSMYFTTNRSCHYIVIGI